MSTLELTENYLKEKGAFQSELPEIVNIALQILNSDSPYKLKLSIVLSELITLTAHLRKSIRMYDGTLVPVNAFIMGLFGSG